MYSDLRPVDLSANLAQARAELASRELHNVVLMLILLVCALLQFPEIVSQGQVGSFTMLLQLSPTGKSTGTRFCELCRGRYRSS